MRDKADRDASQIHKDHGAYFSAAAEHAVAAALRRRDEERDQARAERDRLAARIAELERLCNGELELREHVEAERDRLRRALDEGGGA